MQFKIPGYGRLAVKYAKLQSRINKKNFLQHFEKLGKQIHQMNNQLSIEVVSFSGTKTLDDQLYSILSFFYNVGVPLKWTVYSDKSYTQTDIDKLQSIKNVQVINWDACLVKEEIGLFEFGKKSVFGNRLHAYINHPITTTTFFADSDILFYKGFKRYIEQLKVGNWFMADNAPSFDSFFFEKNQNPEPPFVNAGFLVINHLPNWQLAIDYILKRPDDSSWEHFTEQASIHTMLHADLTTTVMPSNSFIIHCKDSFKFGLSENIGSIALRHFVSPVRHKMWQTSWKEVLG